MARRSQHGVDGSSPARSPTNAGRDLDDRRVSPKSYVEILLGSPSGNATQQQQQHDDAESRGCNLGVAGTVSQMSSSGCHLDSDAPDHSAEEPASHVSKRLLFEDHGCSDHCNLAVTCEKDGGASSRHGSEQHSDSSSAQPQALTTTSASSPSDSIRKVLSPSKRSRQGSF